MCYLHTLLASLYSMHDSRQLDMKLKKKAAKKQTSSSRALVQGMHLCEHKWCAAPWHLELGSHAGNAQRRVQYKQSRGRVLLARGHEQQPGRLVHTCCLACCTLPTCSAATGMPSLLLACVLLLQLRPR